MNKKNKLNLALIIIGLAIIVLGAVMILTVPAELKDNFTGFHTSRYSMQEGQLDNNFRTNPSKSYYGARGGIHRGGVWILPSIILVLVIAAVLRKKNNYTFQGHGRDRFFGKSMDILRKSYASGRMTREEYLERKAVLEQEKEVL